VAWPSSAVWLDPYPAGASTQLLPGASHDGLLASAAWAPDTKTLALARSSTPCKGSGSALLRLIPPEANAADCMPELTIPDVDPDVRSFGGPVGISRDGNVAAVVAFPQSGPAIGSLYFTLNGNLANVCVAKALALAPLRDIRSVAVAPDGRAIYAGTAKGHIYALDIADGATCPPPDQADTGPHGGITGVTVRLLLDTATSAPVWPLLITADGSQMLGLAVTPTHDIFLLE
jgi:hypothetical protein